MDWMETRRNQPLNCKQKKTTCRFQLWWNKCSRNSPVLRLTHQTGPGLDIPLCQNLDEPTRNHEDGFGDAVMWETPKTPTPLRPPSAFYAIPSEGSSVTLIRPEDPEASCEGAVSVDWHPFLCGCSRTETASRPPRTAQ